MTCHDRHIRGWGHGLRCYRYLSARPKLLNTLALPILLKYSSQLKLGRGGMLPSRLGRGHGDLERSSRQCERPRIKSVSWKSGMAYHTCCAVLSADKVHFFRLVCTRLHPTRRLQPSSATVDTLLLALEAPGKDMTPGMLHGLYLCITRT